MTIVRSDKTIANHVSQEAELLPKDIYSVISLMDGGGFASLLISGQTEHPTSHMITEDM